MSTLTNTPFPLPEGLIRAVQAAYAHPPRAYHSFAHAQEVLAHVGEVTAGPGWRPCKLKLDLAGPRERPRLGF